MVVVIMDRHERKTKKKKQAERGDDATLKKVVSLNQEDSLEELDSEKSDEEDKTYFYDKSVSQNVNELGQHLIDKESEDKRAMTQDSSGGQEQNNGSGNEWSMVLEEPNISQDEEHQNQPQGDHIGKPQELRRF